MITRNKERTEVRKATKMTQLHINSCLETVTGEKHSILIHKTVIFLPLKTI